MKSSVGNTKDQVKNTCFFHDVRNFGVNEGMTWGIRSIALFLIPAFPIGGAQCYYLLYALTSLRLETGSVV